MANNTVLILRGRSGYVPLDRPGIAEELNAALPQPPTPAQVEAMLAGSMFGWHVPGADPDRVRVPVAPPKPQGGAGRTVSMEATHGTSDIGDTLVSPLGTAIRGTLEHLTGIARCTASRTADGSVEIEYSGGTELNWDLAETMTRAGPRGLEAVCIDEHGYEWLESDLVEPRAAALPDTADTDDAAQDPLEHSVVVTDWGSLDTCFRVEGQPGLYRGRSPDLDRLWTYAARHLGFHGWLRVVNRRTRQVAACCLLDLPARDWRDEYDGRVPPEEAADVAIDEYASIHGIGPVGPTEPTPPAA